MDNNSIVDSSLNESQASNEINIFTLHKNINELLNSASSEQVFIKRLLAFLLKLTNARGAFLLKESENKNIEIVESLFLLDNGINKEAVLNYSKNYAKEVFQSQKLKVGGFKYKIHDFLVIFSPVFNNKNKPVRCLVLILEIDSEIGRAHV